MAHSSFIDCEVGSSLTENFISEADLKVEIETQQVNDDENVAVEVLGQLGGGNCDSGNEDMAPVISIKTEDTGYAYVHDVEVENCEVVPDIGNTVIVGPDDENTVIVDPNDIISTSHDEDNNRNISIDEKGMVNIENDVGEICNVTNSIMCNNVSNLLDSDKRDYLMCCTICGLSDFNNEIELQNHIYLNHNNTPACDLSCPDDITKPYKCRSCHMTFQRKSSLKNHSKIHTYGVTTNDDYDNNCDESECDDKQKVVMGELLETVTFTTKRKRKRNYKKVAADAEQDRIPPFETLKSAGVPGSATDNYPSLENAPINNIFDEWNLNETKPSTDSCDVNVTTGIALKPISELTGYDPLSHQQDEADDVGGRQGMTPFISTNKDKPYVCPFCNRNFAREKALLNHIRIHNDNYDLTLECQKCHDVFDDIISLQAHLVACVLPESAAIEHHQLPPESPEYVPYEHKRYSFNNNANENISAGDHVCEICSKRFKTRQKVFRHMWVHRRKIFTCEICGLPFPGIKYLDEHRLALHPSKAPFTCTTCGKSFMSKQGLTEHSRLHKGWSDQYFCSYCQKYFSSRQGFTIHGRIHTGERPYGCKYCPKSFRDGGTLKKHERIHTGERPHECPLCHKRYNQKVVLREHIRGVHVMKRNSEINGNCPICTITNLDREELSEHIVRHSDELMKKVKQEFLLKQKSLEKDNRSTVGINRKRRNRILKKVNSNENRSTDKAVGTKTDMNEVETNEDSDYIYPYKQQPQRATVQRGKRKVSRRRAFDRRNAVIKLSNQKKKIDRFDSKKAKKHLKYSVNKKKHNKKNTTNSMEDSVTDNSNTMESEHFLDEECSENSRDQEEECDENKKCLVDFPEDLQPLKLLECEMCHAHFATRSELITHVLVHI